MFATDAEFVQAILAAESRDEATSVRLVYADWLEERGDPRGELLRLGVTLETMSSRDHRKEELETRHKDLSAICSLVWQALVCDRGIDSQKPPTVKEAGPVACPNRICGSGNPPGTHCCRLCQFPLPLAVGSLLAQRYRVDAVLALGGLGYVYRAVDEVEPQVVAIKELAVSSDLDFACLLPLFRQEADLLDALESFPAVPRLHRLVEEERAAYLVLEFLGTQSIADWKWSANFPADFQPLSYHQIADVAWQLCDILAILHAHAPPLLGCLGTRNVYLSMHGGPLRVRVESRTMRRAKEILRTMRERLQGIGWRVACHLFNYPPERMIGYPEERSDFFDLASVSYELSACDIAEGSFTKRIIEESLATRPDEERWLYELIAINLSESPGDRYHTVADLRADLEQRAITRERTCPGCGNRNPVRQPYCAKCDQPLTLLAPRPCPKCGERPRMGSVACRQCGHKVSG